MTNKNRFDTFITKKSTELFQATQEAAKVAKRVPPIGMERVSRATLRERWPTMGKDARQRFMQEHATATDPTGARTVMQMLGDQDA